MAFLHMTFFSHALGLSTSIYAILPIRGGKGGAE